MSEKMNKNQQEYWDKQHRDREQEFLSLEKEPNEFAKRCLKYIKPGGKILEIGVANGRDARYFVRENKNKVVGVDISTEAIRQLLAAAVRDKTIDNILPVIADTDGISEILGNQEYFDAFYARSALHLEDDKLVRFLQYIIAHLNEYGVIMVEGKSNEDFKIGRSIEIGKNCFEDVDGHIRRAWSSDQIRSLCAKFNLEIIEIGNTTEVWNNKQTKFIHFIAREKHSMKKKHQTKAIVSAILLKKIEKDYKIFLQTRWKPKVSPVYSGMIEIPAGGIDSYENIYSALRREVKEETNLNISRVFNDYRGKILNPKKGDKSFIFRPFICQQVLDTNNGLPWIGFVFLCEVSGKVKINSDEAKNPRWVSIQELKKIVQNNSKDIFPLQLPVLQYFIDNWNISIN